MNKRIITLSVAALATASVLMGANTATAATVKPMGVSVSAYNTPTTPKEPGCYKKLIITVNCTARDRFRSVQAQPLTIKSVERGFLATYTPIVIHAPGKKQATYQKNIQNAVTAAYDRLRNNPTKATMRGFKNLTLYQMSLNAQQDNALQAFIDFNRVIDISNVVGGKLAGKSVMEKLMDKAWDKGTTKSIDWAAATRTALVTTRAGDMIGELTRAEF
jgi:hypothetical protein